MPTKVLTAEVPAPLADEVERLAKRMERSPDWVVEQAIGAFIDREARHHAMTLEGMADVDAGRFVSQAEMEAWVDGLDPDRAPLTPR
ncbi:MAG TPA: ribbon-helix-helix protein, CopG family [Caulobacter sp.]|nr:ribbon-helix-helix protein, CopG family [Caulobacter sp.]